jgi:hypothetical protein
MMEKSPEFLLFLLKKMKKKKKKTNSWFRIPINEPASENKKEGK